MTPNNMKATNEAAGTKNVCCNQCQTQSWFTIWLKLFIVFQLKKKNTMQKYSYAQGPYSLFSQNAILFLNEFP